ncbi:MAG: hypothetical protein J5886_04195 [Bacteroidales bacterium]|nr:hypothetical protein [Bacteroidales bacterium]
MKRISYIALAAVLAAMCVLPAAGQSYKASKVRGKSEPEPLTFSRTITTNRMMNSDLFNLTRGWDSAEGHVDNGLYFNAFEDNYMLYEGEFRGLNAKKENYDLWIRMKLYYMGPYRVDLFAYEIITFGDKHPVDQLSLSDDKLNRTWLWRVMHDKETIEMQRNTAEECFNFIADSLEEFLLHGPTKEYDPQMELERID